jgi:hypothetical protein
VDSKGVSEKTKEKEVDIFWQLKKQSREKWRDGRQLRNKAEGSGQ